MKVEMRSFKSMWKVIQLPHHQPKRFHGHVAYPLRKTLAATPGMKRAEPAREIAGG